MKHAAKGRQWMQKFWDRSMLGVFEEQQRASEFGVGSAFVTTAYRNVTVNASFYFPSCISFSLKSTKDRAISVLICKVSSIQITQHNA